MLAYVLAGVADLHPGASEGAAPEGGGVVADLLQGDEVGGVFVEAGSEGGVEGAASVGDVERQDSGDGVSSRGLASTPGADRDVR